MAEFTLRAFEFGNPGVNLDLRQIDAARICVPTATAGKRWLTALIAGGEICSGYFYRFEGMGVFAEVRPTFLFNISFHLFEGGRLCPVRIWNREERDALRGAGPDWTVDFNGVPGWSLAASIEPRWHRMALGSPARVGCGMSAKDWYKRDCWTLHEPMAGLLTEDAA